MIELLVTGMLRSGTTLLEKALNVHPDIKLCYQPFPELFINTKKAFLEKKALYQGIMSSAIIVKKQGISHQI